MKLLTLEEERNLVHRLHAREEKAMAFFYQHYKASLLFTIRRLVRNEELAEDILQEGMLKFWLAFPSYDSSKSRLFTWSLNICRNLAIDALRAQRREWASTYTLSDTEHQGLVAPPTFQPEHIGVREWLDRVTATDRKLLDLLYLRGYTQAEAAQTLQLPLGTVKSRSRRLIQLLARAMGQSRS